MLNRGMLGKLECILPPKIRSVRRLCSRSGRGSIKASNYEVLTLERKLGLWYNMGEQKERKLVEFSPEQVFSVQCRGGARHTHLGVSRDQRSPQGLASFLSLVARAKIHRRPKV